MKYAIFAVLHKNFVTKLMLIRLIKEQLKPSNASYLVWTITQQTVNAGWACCCILLHTPPVAEWMCHDVDYASNLSNAISAHSQYVVVMVLLSLRETYLNAPILMLTGEWGSDADHDSCVLHITMTCCVCVTNRYWSIGSPPSPDECEERGRGEWVKDMHIV